MKMSHVWKQHIRAIKQLHKVNPRYFPVRTIADIAAGVFPYVGVFFSAQVLKELASLRRAEVLWQWVIAGLLAVTLLSLLKTFLEERAESLEDDLYGRKEILFAEKSFSLDYADMDKQATSDLRAQIRQNEIWASWGFMCTVEYYKQILRSITGILSGIGLTVSLFVLPVPESAGMLTILNHPIFILLLAAVMVSVSLLAGKCTAKAISYFSRLSEEATFANRCFWYYGGIGKQPERASDLRMYAQEKIVLQYLQRDNPFSAVGLMGKLAAGPMGGYSALGVGITALVTGFVYVFTCLKALGGAFDIGSVTQYVGAATAMSANIFKLTEMLGEMKTNVQYLDLAFEYLDIPNAMYQGSLTTEKRSDRQYEVEFRNVSFKYPGAENWALRNVSMKFKVGSRLAIVGENGSGKTTFIKLLCRLYDPQEGEILLNGIDIRKYNYRDYMNIFSVVFQDFQLLSQPIGANVAGSSEYDRDRVLAALKDAGFEDRLQELPQGLDTYLYRDFAEDGINVSGGEAQKIAIARALYKDAPFIILDEPTAALDPIAEAEIYAKFNDIAGDKTAVYISHRLSSCKFCDEIAVFHEGGIIQQGTHEELVENENGKYFELWHAQAQYYEHT